MAKRKPLLTADDIFKSIGSELKRTVHSPNINMYKPHPKQEVFHKAVDKKTRLYIGGNRSGKTVAGIVEDVWWLTKRHPYRRFGEREISGRIVSVDFTNGIEKIIMPLLKQWIPPSELRGGSWSDAYEAGLRTLHFDNGSQVELMSYDQDLDKFAGTSRDFIHYDEEPPNDIYTECQMRLIDRKGCSWLTMTPVEGMTWVYDAIYEKATVDHDPYIEVIEVDISENPYLDQDEVTRVINSIEDKDERTARAQGKFVQLGGLVYKAFDPRIHVIDPVDPKEFVDPKYQQYLSLDHGFNNPTAAHWHAVNRQNKVITFDEHYERERIIDYHAQVIHNRNKLHGRIPDVNVCDPALAQRNAITGTSIQTEYAVRGIGFLLGNNDVPTGVAKINQYLSTTGEDGTPLWQITANNTNLIREITRLRWKTWTSKKQRSQNNPYDQIHKKDDHACDECRYFFTLRPELKPIEAIARRVPMPAIGGNSAIQQDRVMVDPNLTPEALGRTNTMWHRVDLGEL